MNSTKSNPLRVGICGLGTVGFGTLNLLKENRQEILQRSGRDIIVTNVATRTLYPEKLKDVGVSGTDPFAVVNDDNVDVVVETMGGYEPAFSVIKAALENGKSVVTANKALVAERGNELFAIAQANGVRLAFESAVAGGIPIIKVLREGLAANKITSLAGIINGTGNFILTEMGAKQREFADVLKEAQALGYAEADPTFDVEGIDAAHKLTIMASIAFGLPLDFSKTYTEGISNVTPEDIASALELGYRIKHLGIAQLTDRGAEVRVHPALISNKQLIAHVNGVGNAVLVTGNAVGNTLYTGPGAGAGATASSVVADLIDIARDGLAGATRPPVAPLGYLSPRTDLKVLSIEEITSEYYLRISVIDKLGMLSKISACLQSAGISIEAVIQHEPVSQIVPIVILTDAALESNLNSAIIAIEELDGVTDKIHRIRIAELSD
ncbi:MAG: homoserine dehydrogenase [Pseudohongiellaceae bacterium]